MVVEVVDVILIRLLVLFVVYKENLFSNLYWLLDWK